MKVNLNCKIMIYSMVFFCHSIYGQYTCDVGLHSNPSPSVNLMTNKSVQSIYAIPIALHIVGNQNFIESIDNDAVSNQLNYVNQVFSGQNEDLINVRKEFESIIGIANIKFEIVKIIYQESSKKFIKSSFGNLGNLEDVKHTNLGGSDPLNINKYLNIWLCDILQPNENQSNVGSYATPPDNAPGWPDIQSLDLIQGIVLNDNNLFLNKKVLVHEIGHYLGLRHIIEFTSEPCEDTDGIEDTPVVFQPIECNFRDSCSETGSDMEENFMNPQVLSCRSAFTQGQVDRMRYILEQFRPDLYTTSASNNHIPSSEVFIYPNVTSDSYKISFADCDFKLVKVNIYSRQGILVDTNQFTSSSIKNLSVAHLPTELYYINIVYGDFTKTFRLVKI